MKITYEVGDIVELEDSFDVPDELGSEWVILLRHLPDGKWTVEHLEDSTRKGVITEKHIHRQ